LSRRMLLAGWLAAGCNCVIVLTGRGGRSARAPSDRTSKASGLLSRPASIGRDGSRCARPTPAPMATTLVSDWPHGVNHGAPPLARGPGPSGKRKSVVRPFLIEYQQGGGFLISICSGRQQPAERRWQSLSKATGRRSDTDGARTAAHRPSRAYVLSCPRRPRCALGLQWAIGSGHRSAQRKEPRQAKPSRHEMK